MKKSSYPLLPVPIALEAIDELKGFVSSLLYSRNAKTRKAILKALFEDDPMIKGPFIDLRLPYKSQEEEWVLNETLKPLAYKYGTPYIHQFRSFRQLQFQAPVNTIVTTGTGSGKSECFSFPVFDYVLHCKKIAQTKGIKAIILYPMNALIDDQGERITQIANQLNKNLDKEMHIRVGRYTGNDGTNREMNPHNDQQIIDDRQSLIENPPDILLTNYRMLDFILMRPEEQSLWDENTQKSFQYLVIDEVHTFDGAQGADVAALLRRLKLKLKKEQITCVGTSATVASDNEDGDPIQDLCQFASTLFGETFKKEHVITNETMSFTEAINQSVSPNIGNYIDSQDLNKKYRDHFFSLIQKWKAPENIYDLPAWISSEAKFSKIFESGSIKGLTLDEIAKNADLSTEETQELLTLLSFARNNSGKMALIPQSTHVWAQGSKYLYRKLSQNIEFIRAESITDEHRKSGIYLPSISCRSCGASGWVTHLSDDVFNEDSTTTFKISTNTSEIMNKFFKKEAYILFEVNSETDNSTYFFDAETERIRREECDSDHPDSIPVHVGLQSNTSRIRISHGGDVLEHCPECDTKFSLSLGLMGTSMLGSVLSGQFLASSFNPSDKKLLIFNDSVQDAHHQAGYLSARGYKFNIRRFLYQTLQNLMPVGTTFSFTQLQIEIKREIEAMWNKACDPKNPAESRKAKEVIIQLLPKDLWERWNADKRSNFLSSKQCQQEFFEKIHWECWFEMSIQSDLGWSLRKTALVLLEPSPEMLKNWVAALERVALKSPTFDIIDKKAYAYGLIRRLIVQGAIFSEEFKNHYNSKKFSKWGYLRKKPHLSSIFSFSQPRLISLNSGERDSYVRLANATSGHSWFKVWGNKHDLLVSEIDQLNALLLKELASHSQILSVNSEDITTYALNPDDLLISRDQAVLKRCTKCSYLSAVDQAFQDIEPSCYQLRCNGLLQEQSDPEQILDEKNYRQYMRNHYNKDLISPLAHPHTGQLKGDDRRRVEDAFKKGLLPGDRVAEKSPTIYKDQPINVLACTPTMEMGIDIGTLSGVALRSFPPSQASAIQRLGRSGRSSGNAYNLILFKDRPHDLNYWQDPNLYFKGSVKTPGCDFRNTQLLIRQFNAFLIDRFASQNPNLRIPKLDADTGITDLKNTEYWSNLLGFLSNIDTSLIDSFTIAVLDQPTNMSPKELRADLLSYWKKDNFKEELSLILDRVSAQYRKDASPTLASDKKDDDDKLVQTQKEHWKSRRQSNAREETYILKILSDRGLLPNYAFPEKGISLHTFLSFESYDTKGEKIFKNVISEIERPPMAGLRDLALGQNYYTDGFKVEVARIEKPEDNEIKKLILCEECGTLSSINAQIDIKTADCPACHARDRSIVEYFDYTRAYAFDRFESSIIRDEDDERERRPMSIETFFEIGPDSKNLMWMSKKSLIGFDFGVHQKIYHYNRNTQANTPLYFKVCQDCYALPYHEDRENQSLIFKDKYKFNRHDRECKYYENPNSLKRNELKDISLARHLTSDVIRVIADNSESVPTLMATLRLAMKKYLKGEAQHLVVESSVIKNADDQQVFLVTLYDNVPGGTGNLRSLMQLSSQTNWNSQEGFKKLASVFEETLTHLKKCDCVQGCYKCLFAYENQYSHSKIFKSKSINWLKRFLEADDWVTENGFINIHIERNFRFGSHLEDKFVEYINSGKASFIDSVLPTHLDGEMAYLIKTRSKSRRYLLPQADKKVFIDSPINYTKPDFSISAGGPTLAYIYVDGLEYHLNPQGDRSTFQDVDAITRSALLRKLRDNGQENGKVLTLTHRMVTGLDNASRSIRTPQGVHSLIEALIQIFFKDTEPEFDFSEVERGIAIFANSALEDTLCGSSSYWSDKDMGTLKRILHDHGQKFKDQRFGGLRFDKKSSRFFMSTTKELRTDGVTIRGSYELSWNLYWVLFYIDPDLVALEP